MKINYFGLFNEIEEYFRLYTGLRQKKGPEMFSSFCIWNTIVHYTYTYSTFNYSVSIQDLQPSKS